MEHVLPPVLSLDIGGTKLAAGVVTGDGLIHGWQVTPTRREEGPRPVLARLFDLGRKAIAEAGLPEVAAVGISCGGPLDTATGVLECPPHLPGWIDVPVGAMAAEAFGVPSVLENDATAAALGEFRYGAGRGTSTMLYLTISTGVGGGSVIGGRLHRGAAGNGGELGHVMVRPGGRKCSCGRLGCLEAYASGTSIAERAREALAAGRPSALSAVELPTAEDVYRAAESGDPLASEIWDETTWALGSAITDLVNAFEPELVVLGGGVTRSGARLLDPVAAAVARDAMPPAARSARIELAQLGAGVCVVGAGAVAHDLLVSGSPLMSDQSALPSPASRPDGRAGETVSLRDTNGEAVLPSMLAEHVEGHLAAARGMAALLPAVEATADLFIEAFARGGTLYTMGNGGSAADAQHLTGELIGHYKRDRRPLPTVTLTTDATVMTCIANDYSYADVFARQVQALARPGDVVAAFTTSGDSPNVVSALKTAQSNGAVTVLFGGGDGGAAAKHADHVLLAPSSETPRIQEIHTLMLHMISEKVDAWAAA